MNAEELEYVHTHNVMDSVQHIFRHFPPEELEKAHGYRKKIDYTDFIRYMTIEPDLKEFLEFLKPVYHTAISTNRTTTMPTLLKMFDLEPYFDKVVTAFDVPRPKPHPDAMTLILKHFGVSVDEAFFIGDSMVDKEHAASVGMPFVAFKNTNLSAAYHVNSFMEITKLPFFRQ